MNSRLKPRYFASALILVLTMAVISTGINPLINLPLGSALAQQATVSTLVPPEVTQYAKDWPLPNRDYGNTRFTSDTAINSSNVNKLKLLWSFAIPGLSTFGAAASNPIIMGNNVFFQDLKANVFSINLRTGQINWEKIYNASGVEGPNGPAVGWGKVFVAKDLYTVAALNASTGQEIWAKKISNVTTTGIDIQPSVYDNLVYVSTVPGTGDIFYAPGGIGVISALDQSTGNIVWNFSTVDTPNLWGHPEINSGGGCWYSPAIDLNTGTMYWGIANPAPFPGVAGWPSGSSRPGPNLYTDSMMALDHKTGAMQWYNQVIPHDLFDHDLQTAPILASANINGTPQDIVIGSGKMGKVYAFNRATGALLWQTAVGVHINDTLDPLPPGVTRVYPGVLGGVETLMAYSATDGILFVPVVDLYTDWTPTSIVGVGFATAKGELVAIDVNSGNILWQKTFDSINVGSTTVVNDLVFTATFDGTIYAFKTTTGQQLFSYKAPAGINGWPAVAGDTIVWPAGVGASPTLIALGLTHDVAVVNVTSNPNATYEGRNVNINVTVTNEGDVVETFNVTTYYNITAGLTVGPPQAVNALLPGQHRSLTFVWNTTGIAHCRNYTITAVASTVPLETDTTDNTLSSAVPVNIKMLGDVNGDGKIDIKDLSLAALSFGSYTNSITQPLWNPQADINGDNRVDIKDLVIIAINFGKTCP